MTYISSLLAGTVCFFLSNKQCFLDYLPWSGFKQYLATTLLYFLVAPALLSRLVAQLLHKESHGRKAAKAEKRSMGNPSLQGERVIIAAPNLPLSFSLPADWDQSLAAVPGLLQLEPHVCKPQHGKDACMCMQIVWKLYPFLILIFYSGSTQGEAATAFQGVINQANPNFRWDLLLWLWFKTMKWKTPV